MNLTLPFPFLSFPFSPAIWIWWIFNCSIKDLTFFHLYSFSGQQSWELRRWRRRAFFKQRLLFGGSWICLQILKTNELKQLWAKIHFYKPSSFWLFDCLFLKRKQIIEYQIAAEMWYIKYCFTMRLRWHTLIKIYKILC